MSSIVIASKSNSLYLAECEVLAEFLAKNLPNFKYSVIKKHKGEWDEFVTSLKNTYGFKRKSCPLVFTLEGQLIGDVGDFYDYAQNHYGKVYRVSKDTLHLRAKNNARAVNEKVRRRDKGPNIIEKIQKSLVKAKKKQLVKNFEGFFKTVVEKGIPFKVRFTDIAEKSVLFEDEIDQEEGMPEGETGVNENDEDQSPRSDEYNEYEGDESPVKDGSPGSRHSQQEDDKQDEAENEGEGDPHEHSEAEGEGVDPVNLEGEGDAVPIDHKDHLQGEGDEEHDHKEADNEPDQQEQEEILPEFPYDPKKKMTYEDFIAFYQDEIEGRLDRRKAIKERENPANDDEEEEKEEDVDHKGANEAEGADGEGEGHDDHKQTNEEHDKEDELAAENEHKERLRIEEEAQELSQQQEEAWMNYKEVNLEKNFVITEDNGYILAVHPTPPMHDVLMLFYQGKYDDDEILVYKDYGLAKRLEKVKIPDDMIEHVEKQKKETNPPVSKVNNSQFDINDPLTPHEWKLWYDIILATKGHGFVQVLPEGYASNQPFKNNLLQILPKKKKQWSNFKIPLNTMIDLREEYFKAESKRLLEEKLKKEKEANAKKPDDVLPGFDEIRHEEDPENEHIHTYAAKSLIKLSEFSFPHCICIFSSSPTEESLVSDYLKIADELQFSKVKLGVGVTIILHKRWMFVAPLTTPYLKMENDLDLFMDPFAYGGILNLHIKKHSWPQTAGVADSDSEGIVIGKLKLSCQEGYLQEEEVEEEINEAEGEGEKEEQQEGDKEGEGNEDE